ncbi:MAG: hypothetical protein AAB699_01630, partial [Patescibacteria group bacterium]
MRPSFWIQRSRLLLFAALVGASVFAVGSALSAQTVKEEIICKPKPPSGNFAVPLALVPSTPPESAALSGDQTFTIECENSLKPTLKGSDSASATVLARPDLTASVVSVTALTPGAATGKPNEFYEDATLRFTGKVTNETQATGAAPAPASKTGWKIFKATTGRPTPPAKVKDQPTESEVTTAALALGADATLSREIAKIEVGTHYFGLCADSPNAFLERNEDNNCSASWLKIVVVQRPPVPVGASLTCNGAPGVVATEHPGECKLDWSAQNVSSCAASANPANANWSGGVAASGSKTVSGLTANTTFTFTCQPLAGSGASAAVRSVTAVPFSARCSANPATPSLNQPIAWSADASRLAPGNAYVYSWSGAVTGGKESITAPYPTGGEKSAQVSIGTTVNGTALDPKLAKCKAKVAAPDLLGNIPNIVCKGTGKPNECFVGSATISGSAKNDGDADARAGLKNQYRFSASGAPGSFSAFQDDAGRPLSFPFTPDGTLARGGGTRSLQPHEWQAGAGIWYFDLCADSANQELEWNSAGTGETNNCGAPTGATFVKKTKLAVASTLDGVSAPGAEITQRGGAPSGLGGRTDYRWEVAEAIKGAKLEAPPTHAGGSFIAWGGCDNPDPSNPVCAVSVAAGEEKKIAAQYGKSCNVDIKFNGKDGPVAALQGTSGALTWSSTNAKSVTASAEPARPGWSGTLPLSNGVGKETGALERPGRQTFFISCANDTRKTVTDFVDVEVVSGSLSCGDETKTTEETQSLAYSYSNASAPSLFRSDAPQPLTTFPGGTRRGSFLVTGLAPGTTYGYTLRDARGVLLATTDCQTRNLPNLVANQPELLGLVPAGAPHTYYAGEKTTLRGSVTNRGPGVSSGVFQNNYQISTDGARFSDWVSRALESAAPLVKDGTRVVAPHPKEGEPSWIPRHDPTTRYYFKLRADSQGEVSETNEADNDSPAIGPFTFVQRPVIGVTLKVNGKDTDTV